MESLEWNLEAEEAYKSVCVCGGGGGPCSP